MQPRRLVTLALAFEGGLAVIAWVVGSLIGIDPLQQITLTWQAAGWGLLASLPMALVLFLVPRSSWPPLRNLDQVAQDLIVPIFERCNPVELALIAAFAGLGEEMLFRGLIQPALALAVGSVPALLLTSLAFGALHPITRAYVVLAALIGIYLGILQLITGNLLVPIIAHAVYDFVALIYLVYFRRYVRPPITH